jgi:hypothetical protein
MSEEKEAFLSRWSRLKREAPEKEKALEQKKAAEAQPAPALPPVESLTPQSEFTGFMHPQVEDKLRRLALKKLFSDPHFNTPDPFEPFSGDWTGGEPISPELLATLNQARSALWSQEEREQQDKETQAAADAAQAEPKQLQEGESKQDESGRKDT